MEGYPPGSIWPASDAESAQVREVYARYGLAMYQAHVLEHGMANAVFVLRMIKESKNCTDRASWETKVDHFYEAEFSKTFGNIIRALEGIAALPQDIIAELRSAKNKRDALAHRFFREHASNFMSQSGRTRMITECESFIEFFHKLDKKIEAIIEPEQRRFGITQECIDRQIALMNDDA